jgi:hypothetical protein
MGKMMVLAGLVSLDLLPVQVLTSAVFGGIVVMLESIVYFLP